MDSKVVSKAIRAQVWPLLTEYGFGRFTTRSACRDHDDRVDVVNFNSFNRQDADVLGVTTFSFTINLGCYLKYIPETDGGAVISGVSVTSPEIQDCHMRAQLKKGYFEFMSKRPDIWELDRNGKELPKAIENAKAALLKSAMPWFERFKSPLAVYQILATIKDEDMINLWGFGSPGSPIRCYFLGYAARFAGVQDAIRPNLLKAAEHEPFSHIARRLIADAEAA